MNEIIISSPENFNSFINSSMYTDLMNELDNRIEALTILLRDEDLVKTGRDYDLYRGGLKNMEQMKTIFHDLMNNKITDLEKENVNAK